MGKETNHQEERKRAWMPAARSAPLAKSSKRRLEKGILHVEATFNNTKAVLTDEKGNAVMASSAGALGFSEPGSPRRTPPRRSESSSAKRRWPSA